MKRNIGPWELMGFAVVSLLGTLLHFLYDFSDGSLWVAPFSAVNESTWEHMKLLFFPMLLFAIVESFFFSEYKSFWCIKARGTALGLSLIPVIFYTYNGVIGRSPDWINISIFFVSAAIAFIYEAKLFKSGDIKCAHPRLALAFLCILAVLFVLFTFRTPEIGIFSDPTTLTYGI